MLAIDVSKPYSVNPRDYGRKDWHHNEKGQVDYPCYYDSTQEYDKFNPEPIENQQWQEDLSEDQLDSLAYGRYLRASRLEGINDYWRWVEEWN